MKRISPCDSAAIGTLIAIELGKDKNVEDLLYIKNIASQVASTLATMACQVAHNEKNCKSSKS